MAGGYSERLVERGAHGERDDRAGDEGRDE
jgi:hypothetical protein